MPLDLCHDPFETFAVDVTSNIIIAFIRHGVCDLDDFNDIFLKTLTFPKMIKQQAKNHFLWIARIGKVCLLV